MKRFFKNILLGLFSVLISLSSIGTFIVSVMSFIEIPNLKGFLVLGVTFLGIILFLIGVYFTYVLGEVISNSREHIKQQEEERKQCQNKIP